MRQQAGATPDCAGGESVFHVFATGSKEIAALTDGLYVVFVKGRRPKTISLLPVQMLAPYGRATGSRATERHVPPVEPARATVASRATTSARSEMPRR